MVITYIILSYHAHKFEGEKDEIPQMITVPKCEIEECYGVTHEAVVQPS